jgi:hypothetical protein
MALIMLIVKNGTQHSRNTPVHMEKNNNAKEAKQGHTASALTPLVCGLSLNSPATCGANTITRDSWKTKQSGSS